MIKMLLSLFYSLRKDYGCKITYTKPGKGDIDSETGVRSVGEDKTYLIDAVEAPVDHQGDFILKLLGKTEKPKTVFLVRFADLPTVATDDYFTSQGIKYKIRDFSNLSDTLIELSGETFT